jgi:hypothetical protein
MRPFDELVMHTPQLAEIESRAFAYRREARGRSPVCRAWLFYNAGAPSIREELVLLLRHHDPQALAVAENHLWEILPACTGCACAR